MHSQPVTQRGGLSRLLQTCLFGFGVVFVALTPKPACSAERIFFDLGPLELSVTVESLETYAATGEITGEFRTYASFLGQDALNQLREALQRSFEVSHVAVSQFTYSPIGATAVERLGGVIQTQSGQNGFHAIRSALILAAADPAGLSILSLLRYFPTEGIRLDVRQVLALRRELTTLFDYRDAAIAAIAQQADLEASTPPTALSQLSDLQQPGPLSFTQQTLVFNNLSSRQSPLGEVTGRSFEADLYLPQETTQPAPVIVISHGLGSERRYFAYLAEHLASHGFAAIVPEHIGSDEERQRAILEGLLFRGINPVEFVDRPLDVRYALDELERLSETEPTLVGRLDLKRVGAIGHSFGGYTVLALAGAEINHDRLKQECGREDPTLNVSLLLQCRASSLPPFNYNLRDSRVRAAMAINPIASTVLGPESLGNIEIPVLIAGGSGDIVTPVVPEQIHPFIWLTTAEKYLALLTPASHLSTNAVSANQSLLSKLLIGPDTDLGQQYTKALSLAFVQAHVNDRPEYRAYLSAAYAESVSQDLLDLDLVQSLTPMQLEAAFGAPPPEPILPATVATPLPDRPESILREIEQTGLLKAGIRQDTAPFSYLDDTEQPTGYCLELLNSFADQLEAQLETPIRLEIAPSTLDNRFEIVRDQTVHLECGPNTIRTDVAGVAFSTPFFITGTQFLIPADKTTNFDTLGSLTNVRMGVLRNSLTEQFVQTQYPQSEAIKFRGATGRTEALQALLEGQIDTFASDGILLVGQALTQKNLSPTDYSLVPERPLTCDAYGLILPADDAQWRSTVNAFIGSDLAGQTWDSWFSDLFPYVLLNLDYCVERALE
ncbi:MAG: alpha/beta fold hydrolase [Cyanothece sp. SIO1E1]|nr:alpha/beta fold hydrolase [Cyanothece sp. SIO1E1]